MTLFRRQIFPLRIKDIDQDLYKSLNFLDQNLSDILDGGLNFSDNFDSVFVTYTSNAIANTEDSVSHLLGKVPTGYIVVKKDKAADVYNTSALTSTVLRLKCSVSSAALTLLVF
jgi:hypothetical protein